jgi:hypothetical protein
MVSAAYIERLGVPKTPGEKCCTYEQQIATSLYLEFSGGASRQDNDVESGRERLETSFQANQARIDKLDGLVGVLHSAVHIRSLDSAMAQLARD